jgi:hypothetical protein
MGEKDYASDHVNWIELIVKEVANVGHPILDKIQVTTILNSLPLSWEHVVTCLTHSDKEIFMISLPMLVLG